MRHLLLILFLFLAASVTAQINPRNFPVDVDTRDSLAFYSNEGGVGYDESVKVYWIDLVADAVSDATSSITTFYTGDGTAPADLDITVTDNIDFDGGTLYIDGASNEIGIGTTSPSSPLEVFNTTQQVKLSYDGSNSVNFGSDGNGYFNVSASGDRYGFGITVPAVPFHFYEPTAHARMESTTGTNYAITQYLNTGGSLYIGRERSTGGGFLAGTAAYDGAIRVTGSYDFHIGNDNGIALTVDGGGSEIGIGTTSPNWNLHLHEDGTTGMYIQTTNNTTGTTASDGLLFGMDNSEQGFIWNYENTDFRFGTGGAEFMRAEATGEVGIGTTTPDGMFHVAASANESTEDLAIFSELTETAGRVVIGLESGAGVASFYSTGGAEKIKFDANGDSYFLGGNVGIGTNSPTELLDIDSDAIRIRSSQTPASASATGTAGMIAWDANYIYVCTATDTWKRVAISTW